LWFDQSWKWSWIYLYGLLHQTVEQLATGCRRATVEAESKLIKVGVQVIVPNCPLVSAQQPALEERNDPMNARQQVFFLWLTTLNLTLVGIAAQLPVSLQTVRSDSASRLDGSGNKPVQAGPGQVRDVAQAYAANAFPILLSGHDNQGFFFRSPSNGAGFLAAPVRLVHFNYTIQAIAARTNHRPTQFVQDRPGGFVAAQTQHTL